MNMHSLIVPVYKNEASISDLLNVLQALNNRLDDELEVVFVVDGSPDQSFDILRKKLPTCQFHAQLMALSRNFGSMAAVREGLASAHGPYFCTMAADLQEPLDLIYKIFTTLQTDEADVIVATREKRGDPPSVRIASCVYWFLYRIFIQSAMPAGGVDIFGCNQAFRNQLLLLSEANSSLIGLLFWLGFRRKEIGYVRRARKHGKSAWTLRRKLSYMSDSVFSFSDLPIRLLAMFGVVGVFVSTILSILVLAAKLTNAIDVPGYAATVLIIFFFAALNSLGLGIIGSYVWRAFENTKRRPLSVVLTRHEYGRVKGNPSCESGSPSMTHPSDCAT